MPWSRRARHWVSGSERQLRTIRGNFLVFLALLGVCLALAVPLSLSVYTDDTWPAGERVVVVVVASLVSAGVAIGLIVSCQSVRGLYAGRRRPFAWIAIRVLEVASRESDPPVTALGIGSREGELVIRLLLGVTNPIAEGDSFLVLNAHTKEQLGSVFAIAVDHDSCLCMVSDKMNRHDFWANLENRMMSDFSAPPGVEFRFVDQVPIDIVRTLIRRWGG